MWAKLLGQRDVVRGADGKLSTLYYFPSYEEAEAEARRADQARSSTTKFVALPNGDFFNCSAYRMRVRMVIEPFLLDANERGQDANAAVHVHAIALGLCSPAARRAAPDFQPYGMKQRRRRTPHPGQR